MKKLFVILIVVLVFVFGCSRANSNFKDRADLESQDGLLQVQKESDGFAGTHLLRTDTNKEVPLRSLSINLSDEKYLNNKVEVLGFLNSDDGVFEVTGITVQEILAPSETTTKDLLSYSNDDLGFIFNYPNVWTFIETNNSVNFSDDSGKLIFRVEHSPYTFIQSYDENGDVKIDDPVINYLSENNLAGGVAMKIGKYEIPAQKIETTDEASYFLYRSGFVYKLVFQSSLDVRIANDIVSSFQFIVVDEVDNGDSNVLETEMDNSVTISTSIEFTSFESFPYHFKGLYPANWYYAGIKGQDDDIIHHYGFSDEAVTNDNELISLDLIATDIPFGKKVSVNDHEVIIKEDRDQIIAYVAVDNNKFRIKGSEDYRDILIYMLSNISAINETL